MDADGGKAGQLRSPATLETHRLAVRIGTVVVCNDLHLALEPGQSWALLGRNGAGKTTLLHTLAGLRKPTAGEVRLHQRALPAWTRRVTARHIGLLFQDYSDAFPSTVLETALIGRHPHLGMLQWESDDDIALARQALQSVELEDFEDRMVSTLSGGERRRLAIAALLTQDPELLLLDEPTNHLDLHHQLATLELFRVLTGECGKTLMMAVHDVNLAARFCSHVLLLLGNGETVQGSTADVLTVENLSRLYGHPMLRIEQDAHCVYVPA